MSDKAQYFLTIFSSLVSVTSIFISYKLGITQSNQIYKRDTKLNIYKTFYVTYIQTLYKNFYWGNPPREHTFEVLSIYFDLISNNLQYLEVQIVELYPQYYEKVLNMFEYFDENSDFINAPLEYEDVFNKITLLILEEGIKIANELSLPPLAKPLYDFFLHNNNKYWLPI